MTSSYFRILWVDKTKKFINLGCIQFSNLLENRFRFRIPLNEKTPDRTIKMSYKLKRGVIVSIHELGDDKSSILNFDIISEPKGLTNYHPKHEEYSKSKKNRFLYISSLEARKSVLAYSKLVSEIRSFLISKNYLEINTPTLNKRYNGGVSQPFITGFSHKNKVNDLYLKSTHEIFLKTLLCTEFEKVFEIGKVFRNEGKSKIYYPEFPMLEIYQLGKDLGSILNLLLNLLEKITESLEYNKVIEKSKVLKKQKWKKISVINFFKENYKIDLISIDSSSLVNFAIEQNIEITSRSSKSNIVSKLISQIIREKNIGLAIITDLPGYLSPLFLSEEGKAKRYWLFADNVDFCDLGLEQINLEDMKIKFQEQKKFKKIANSNTDEQFIELLTYGTPPIGGCGLSVSRLLMYLLSFDKVEKYDVFSEI